MEEYNKKVSLICALIIIIRKRQEKKKRKPRWWMTTLLKNRQFYGGDQLLQDLKAEKSERFQNFCRMSLTDFEALLKVIEPKIMKQDTNYRIAISARERLALTLRFVATGDSYSSLMYLFKISKASISRIIPEVCDAIVEALRQYVKIPQSEKEWLDVAAHFEELWNFPHCCGALDGKHVVLQAPINSGSDFFNYKSTFSIVLMALVDADYCFLYADVGCQGRISDGGVFRNTNFFQKLQQNNLHLPPEDVLKGRQKPIPYVFVADEAFAMQRHILKPYAGVQEKGSIERIFNYRLSRARRLVENAFGILSAVFRVLRRPMLLEPEKVKKIVLACVYLHNFLRKSKHSRNVYSPPDTFDQEVDGKIVHGAWREENKNLTSVLPLERIPRKSTQACYDNRKEFAEYFATDIGKVPWQDFYE